MKKFYNEPEMNISMFEVENVATENGDVAIASTAVQAASKDLDTKYQVVLDWSK